jgi:hypothetical protein
MTEFADDAFKSVKAFARYMLRDGRLTLRPVLDGIWAPTSHPSQPGRFGLACILFRSGCWQVEMLVGLPNCQAPAHRHNRVDSVDVILCGGVTGGVNHRAFADNRGSLLANLVRVPAGEWHGGAAKDSGVVYLSFQKWQGEPTFIGLDWESHDGD